MFHTFTALLMGLVVSPLLLPETVSPSALQERKSCQVWGQVAGSARLLQEGLDVEMLDPGGVDQRVHLLADGNFDFSSVPAGVYHFRVRDHSGTVILEQTKSLGGTNDLVLLVVRDPRLQLAATNTVSLSSLQHRTPSRAWDIFKEAQKANASGDASSSAQLLNEALRLDPNFAEAHSDLAAIYASMGHNEEALEQAYIAFDLNPQLPEAGSNIALLLLKLKRYAQAETAARQVLNSQYYASLLHGALAISLIEQRKKFDEALDHVVQAAPEFPFVRLSAAQALLEASRPDLAVVQVIEYLKSSAHPCERLSLETWLASVQSQLASQAPGPTGSADGHDSGSRQ